MGVRPSRNGDSVPSMSSPSRIRLTVTASALAGLTATALLAMPATGAAAPFSDRTAESGHRSQTSKVVVPTLTARATLSAGATTTTVPPR